MRFKKKAISLLLATIMVFSLIPTSAFAIDGSLNESRDLNALEFTDMKFWYTYNSGHSGWFKVPVDSASGMALFCVDPGLFCAFLACL